MFDKGQLVASGTPEDIVDTYVSSVASEGPRILSIRGWRLNGSAPAPLDAGGPCVIEVDFDIAAGATR